jgi:hypothetical protein
MIKDILKLSSETSFSSTTEILGINQFLLKKQSVIGIPPGRTWTPLEREEYVLAFARLQDVGQARNPVLKPCRQAGNIY